MNFRTGSESSCAYFQQPIPSRSDVSFGHPKALGVAESPCSALNTGYGTECGTVTDWADGDFGIAYTNGIDYFAYEADARRVSYGEIGLVRFGQAGEPNEYDDWDTVSLLDSWSVEDRGHATIFLLFGEAAVAEPGTAVLIGLGLLALSLRNRREV